MIAGVERAIERCDEQTKVVPGHGVLTDRAGLQQYLAVLEDFRAAVAEAKAGGMGLEELLESDVTAAVDERWDGKMFPSGAFRELVYRSLP
jgi:glyoxylase-like metal-dependent hydrolase (beta-lactamase superfamily II)